jgi:maltose alpha-D-glucosyltransferase/alpha-amylase
MHLTLASTQENKNFKPEEFSLHYQRSLYSYMQSLVRETYQNLDKKINILPYHVKIEVYKIADKKNEILTLLKKIYSKKINAQKIRIHGNYNLQALLLTGKDIVIRDFGNEVFKSFSERRIKRTVMADIAGMICSMYYVAYEGFFTTNQLPKDDTNQILHFADLWAHYITGFFMKSYYETINGSNLIPQEKDDLKILLRTMLLEKALFNFNIDINNRPEWAVVPVRLIQSILK